MSKKEKRKKMSSVSCSNIVIGGKRYDFPTCKSLSIVGSKVYVDGVEYKQEGEDEPPVKIEFHNCTFEKVSVKRAETVSINGSSVGSIKSSTADITVHGDVSGNVSTSTGNVMCEDISGNVKISTGDLLAETIHGSASVKAGTITERPKRAVRTFTTTSSDPKRCLITQTFDGPTIGATIYGSTVIHANMLPEGTPSSTITNIFK